MSTEFKTRSDTYFLTRFYAGSAIGVYLQITNRQGKYTSIPMSEVKRLAADLTQLAADGTLPEAP